MPSHDRKYTLKGPPEIEFLIVGNPFNETNPEKEDALVVSLTQAWVEAVAKGNEGDVALWGKDGVEADEQARKLRSKIQNIAVKAMYRTDDKKMNLIVAFDSSVSGPLHSGLTSTTTNDENTHISVLIMNQGAVAAAEAKKMRHLGSVHIYPDANQKYKGHVVAAKDGQPRANMQQNIKDAAQPAAQNDAGDKPQTTL